MDEPKNHGLKLGIHHRAEVSGVAWALDTSGRQKGAGAPFEVIPRPL